MQEAGDRWAENICKNRKESNLSAESVSWLAWVGTSKPGRGQEEEADESKTGWSLQRCPCPQGYGSFVRRRWIPFSDLNTTFASGTGTLEGSGASSKRSRVRATATFISFMANCFPMQFLGEGGKRHEP